MLLVSSMLPSAPVFAIDCTQPPQPQPIIDLSTTAPLVCINTEPRVSDAPNFPPFGASVAIGLVTQGDGNSIRVDNSGPLTATLALPAYSGPAIGIVAVTGNFGMGSGAGAFIDITNIGDIVVATDNVSGGPPVAGILGLAFGGPGSFINIDNSGSVTLSVGTTVNSNVIGVGATTFVSQSRVGIENRGDVRVGVVQGTGTSAQPLLIGALGSQTQADGSPIEILNVGGDLKVTVDSGADVNAFGMYGQSFGSGSPVRLKNSGGDITVPAVPST